MTALSKKETWIPKLPKSEIRKRAKHIKRVMRFRKKGLCYVKPVDLFNRIESLDFKPAGKADDLKKLCEIITYHLPLSGGNSLEEPMAEFLAQIPAEHLDKIVAFEIMTGPTTWEPIHDMEQFKDNPKMIASRAGYASATTRLYVYR